MIESILFWLKKLWYVWLLCVVLLALSLFTFVVSNTSFERDFYAVYLSDNPKQEFADFLDTTDILSIKGSFEVAKVFAGFTPQKGLHKIPRGLDNLELIELLEEKPRSSVKVPIGNYRFRYPLTVNVCSGMDIKSKALRRCLTDSATCSKYGFNCDNVYCMFVNDTLYEYRAATGKELFESIYMNWLDIWDTTRMRLCYELELSPIEVTILASIVDAETRYDDEMSKVAGLYINRLRDSIRLQSDPTVVYANGQKPIRRILKKHLKSKNKYNTYRHGGLPPGPVYVPTIKAIDAVLNYEKHDYYFFVASSDQKGYHDFSKTFEEHREKANAYRRELNRKHIY